MLNILAKIRPLSRAVHHRSGINYNGPERTKTTRGSVVVAAKPFRATFLSFSLLLSPPFIRSVKIHSRFLKTRRNSFLNLFHPRLPSVRFVSGTIIKISPISISISMNTTKKRWSVFFRVD